MLVDERGKRRRVSLVTGATADTPVASCRRPTTSPRALAPMPTSASRAAHRGSDTGLIDEKVSVLVLADVGALDRDETGGGPAALRRRRRADPFAGSRLAARRRPGAGAAAPRRPQPGRLAVVDAPKTLAPFTRDSPSSASACRRRSTCGARSGPSRTATCRPDLTAAWPTARRSSPPSGAVRADRAVSRHRRPGLVRPAAVRRVRRHAAPHRVAGRPADRSVEREPGGRSRRWRRSARWTASAPSARHSHRQARGAAFAGRARRIIAPGFYGPNDAIVAVQRAGRRRQPRVLDISPLQTRVLPIARAATIDLRAVYWRWRCCWRSIRSAAASAAISPNRPAAGPRQRARKCARHCGGAGARVICEARRRRYAPTPCRRCGGGGGGGARHRLAISSPAMPRWTR